jgi:MFS family permease
MALMELPWSISWPFMPLFAHQFKGADEFVLGSMAVAMSIAPLLASIPLGQLADRHGRKRLLFAIAPIAYAANVCLIFAPGRNMLLLSGLFFGFNSISMAITSAMAAEIVPQKQMGRWTGIVSLVRGLTSIPAPLIGGLIWDQLGPHYVFVATIAIDILARLPLLASVRETLYLQVEPDGPSQDKRSSNKQGG